MATAALAARDPSAFRKARSEEVLRAFVAAGAADGQRLVPQQRGDGLSPIADVVRTPDERFAGLAKVGYPFAPNYTMLRSHGALRCHYVDEGPRDAAETILLMHGQPTWSFLYRKVVPPLAAAGYRVVCPDFIGFGRSDKPARKADYTYERHVDWMTEFVVALGLDNVTFFGQDWGGLIGLRVVARLPDRFLRLAIGNTFLPKGDGISKLGDTWRGYSQIAPNWRDMLQLFTADVVPDDVLDAYEAPFATEAHRAGSRAFPPMIPTDRGHDSVEECLGAWKRLLHRWTRPFLTCWSDCDFIMPPAMAKLYQQEVPGARGVAHTIIRGASHFLQEDKGAELADILIAFCRAHPQALNPPQPAARL